MTICLRCKRESFVIDLSTGLCMDCTADFESGDLVQDDRSAEDVVVERGQALERVMLTTEATSSLPIADRLGIVTAECVYGMNVFKDIAAGARDFFGGRSKVLQAGLREARETVLDELRMEAAELGADAVVAVNLSYSQIATGTGAMLLLVASGTAVTLAHTDLDHDARGKDHVQ